MSRPRTDPIPDDAPLRTYTLRTSRMGAVRRAALDTVLERYAVPQGDSPLDLAAVFGTDAPVVLEIGFGVGASTLAMAEADPSTNVLASEVHTPGVATLVLGLDERGLGNVRVAVGDGREILEQRIAPGRLAGVRVYFPDPWPKSRHHKRRLVDARFTALVADRLAPGGLLHCATDWEPYAEQMIEVLTADPDLDLGENRERPEWRPVTRYETKGLSRGHRVTDLFARRKG